MERKISACRGALLGLAIGDAMGFTVDEMSWQDIRNEYGNAGLLGYDLRNDTAQVTSYTQIAAYTTNGLLLGLTRGRQDAYLRYIRQALQEWYKRQHFPRDPERSACWISRIPELRRRNCRDARMMEALRGTLCGSPEAPVNGSNSPGAVLEGAVIGLFYDHRRLSPERIGKLAVEAVALTHGDPEAYLSAAVLAYAVAGIIQEPQIPLRRQFLQAIAATEGQFGETYPKVHSLAETLRSALKLAADRPGTNLSAMEQLRCDTAGQCLAGAMYACLVNRDFDGAMITAVNHSGRSGAVAAIAGAVMGAHLAEEALPDFYLESLEAAPALRILAEDLAVGSPATSLFDDAWDHKYTQGLPLGEDY